MTRIPVFIDGLCPECGGKGIEFKGFSKSGAFVGHVCGDCHPMTATNGNLDGYTFDIPGDPGMDT